MIPASSICRKSRAFHLRPRRGQRRHSGARPVLRTHGAGRPDKAEPHPMHAADARTARPVQGGKRQKRHLLSHSDPGIQHGQGLAQGAVYPLYRAGRLEGWPDRFLVRLCQRPCAAGSRDPALYQNPGQRARKAPVLHICGAGIPLFGRLCSVRSAKGGGHGDRPCSSLPPCFSTLFSAGFPWF